MFRLKRCITDVPYLMSLYNFQFHLVLNDDIKTLQNLLALNLRLKLNGFISCETVMRIRNLFIGHSKIINFEKF